MSELVLRHDQGGITTLTLNRPDKLNALNKDTVQEIGEAVNRGGSEKEVSG